MLQLGAIILFAFIVWSPHGSQAKSSEEHVPTSELSVPFRDIIPLLDFMALHRSNCSEAVHVNETLEKLSGIEAKQKEMQQSLASLLDGQLELRTLNERVAELVFQVKEFKDTTDTLKHLLHSYFNETQESLNTTKVPPPLAGIKQPKFEKIGSHPFYIENNMRVTWDGAIDMCRAMGGELAFAENVLLQFDALEMKLHGKYCYWSGPPLEDGLSRPISTPLPAGCSASARLGNSR
ncbi:uncharacterized protein LOC122611842 [Drosophila teissieri]|uniref:uncharacterized protein LOC122611842 n=1 Tax=Drosophila teissieri TaxID=7243 RepID=UPI001CBA3017|nr:uncharacterized protein LOC122611842 [Drosophila teissieri]